MGISVSEILSVWVHAWCKWGLVNYAGVGTVRSECVCWV